MDDSITRAEHEEFRKRFEAEDARLSKRVSIVEDDVRELRNVNVAIEKLAANMDATLKELERQGKRLEALEARDGEMWRKVTGYIVTAIIGIVIGFLFTQLGM